MKTHKWPSIFLKWPRGTRPFQKWPPTSRVLSTTIVREVHSHSSGSTCAEQLALCEVHRAVAQSACAEQLAQTNLHRAHAQSACTEQLAQSTCAEQLAQSTCAEQLAQSTCVQQLAESNLRAAAWNNAACADHFRENSRGAVREETRMMRWSSHVTIHIEHRRVQTRSPQQCKKVSPRLDEHLGKNAFGPVVL